MKQGSQQTKLYPRILGLLILGLLYGTGGSNFFSGDGLNVNAAAFPDTYSCDNTPALDFPTTVTISKEYLAITSCNDEFSLSGDFVTMYISTPDNEHIKNISNYEVTDAGVEWVTPVTDSNGTAWERVYIDPGYMDCNSTGVPYSLKVNWDGQLADVNFAVVCPTIEFDYYRLEVPNFEALRVVAKVTDNKGYAMRNIPCKASVISLSMDENFATVKQENIIKNTDASGKARFEFETGLLRDLLQGYEYTVVVDCLGGDGNFAFEIAGIDDSNLRNPLYFIVVYLSDNIIPIMIALIVTSMAIGSLYFLIQKGKD